MLKNKRIKTFNSCIFLRETLYPPQFFLYPPQKLFQISKMFELGLQLILLLVVGNVAARSMKTNEREVREEYQSLLRRVVGHF